MKTMKDQVVIVTGAAGGIGLSTAEAFAGAGAIVVLADINEPVEQAEKLTAKGYKAVSIRCDVADEKDVAAMIDQIVSKFGRLDVAYNNAGINSPVAETADASSEEYDKVMAINLRGVWNCMKYELRQMRRQGSGAIVNCSSIGGLIGIADRGVYHASKHGVIGLTKSAALEYAARGIRINAVCPGIIATPMVEQMMEREPEAMKELIKEVPIGRLGRPEEIAAVALWLCSPAASLIIGQAIAVDGGYTVR
ncbi:MAG: SDR family oxidoreductase [Bacteroidetes bacterium]|nr:MAG: SDR family oxidoreductase [Bacteroidota bacterium]